MKRTCCEMRRKVAVILGPALPVEGCGVPDSVLADFMRWDLDGPVMPDGRQQPVIGFAFCPWCGTRLTEDHEVRVTGVVLGGPG